MSTRTLPSLSHPAFPQVFRAAIAQEVTRVSTQLSLCCYESPAEGLCGGGYPCNEIAVVHDVATELDYCWRHYQGVRRG